MDQYTMPDYEQADTDDINLHSVQKLHIHL